MDVRPKRNAVNSDLIDMGERPARWSSVTEVNIVKIVGKRKLGHSKKRQISIIEDTEKEKEVVIMIINIAKRGEFVGLEERR